MSVKYFVIEGILIKTDRASRYWWVKHGKASKAPAQLADTGPSEIQTQSTFSFKKNREEPEKP